MSKKHHHKKKKNMSSSLHVNNTNQPIISSKSSSSLESPIINTPELINDYSTSYSDKGFDQALYKASLSFFRVVTSIPQRLRIRQIVALLLALFMTIKKFALSIGEIICIGLKSTLRCMQRFAVIVRHLIAKPCYFITQLLTKLFHSSTHLLAKLCHFITLLLAKPCHLFFQKTNSLVRNFYTSVQENIQEETVQEPKTPKSKSKERTFPSSKVDISSIPEEALANLLTKLKQSPEVLSKKKQLIKLASSMVALVLILSVAIYTFGTNSTAWFSNNKTVTATGMSVRSDVSEHLQISTTPEGVTDKEYYDPSLTAIVYSSSVAKLSPATLVSTDHTLIYYSPADISPATHLPKDGAVSHAAVKNQHYVEYTVYLGVSGHSLSFTNLQVSFGGSEPTDNYLKSISADVFLGKQYISTLSLDNIANSKADLGITSLSPGSPIGVTLRFYFDGAKINPSDGTPYLKTTSVATASIKLKVLFTAVNPSQSN